MFTDTAPTDLRVLGYTISAVTIGLILSAVIVGAVITGFVLKRRKRQSKNFMENVRNVQTDATTIVLQERSMNVTYNAYEDMVCVLSCSNGFA